MRRAKTETISRAMRILSEEIQSEDGVANAAIREAADRLDEQAAEITKLGEFHRRRCEALKAEQDIMREALMRVQNFPSLPGGREDGLVDERDDPATNWRHGWICAVEEMQKAAIPHRRKRR